MSKTKEEHPIVLGMACPNCRGPVHNPTITKQRRNNMPPLQAFFDADFACSNCGWVNSGRVQKKGDPGKLVPGSRVWMTGVHFA